MTSQVAPRSGVRTALEDAVAKLARFVQQSDATPEIASAMSVVEAHLGDKVRVGRAKQMLGVRSATTIKKWIALGRFPHAERVHGQWRIPVLDIEAVQESGRFAVAAAMRGPQPMAEYQGDPTEDLIG